MKKLTRDEMKNVLGGVNAPPGDFESCGKSCTAGTSTLSCTQDFMGGCIKPTQCNNAVDCKW